jgi:predicted PurR-regulated permease PerM
VIPLPFNTATRVGINLLLVLGVVIALRLGQTFFIPTLIALLLAAVLAPAADWLNRKLHFRWGVACLVVIVGLVLVNLLIMAVFIIAVPRMLQVLPRPDDEKQQLQVYNAIRAQADKVSPWALDPDLFPANPDNVREIRVFQFITDFVAQYAPRALLEITIYGTSWLWQWVLILFILLFLLLEGRLLTRRAVEVAGPSKEVQARAGFILRDIARQVRTYLVWRTIINFGLAVVVGIVYQVAGLHQAWTWAMMLAILNYIPYLGPLVAGVPAVLDAFLSISPLGALFILAFYIGIIVIEGYVVVPVLMGRSMELNATTVMLACLFWDLIWGTLGLFLAMPIMAAIRAICYHVPGWRPWANLMGTADGEATPPVPLELAAAGLAPMDEPLPEPSPHDTVIRVPAVPTQQP